MEMRRKRPVWALVTLMLLAVGLSACGNDDDGGDDEATATTEAAASGPNVVTIKEQDYAFTLEGKAREGWLTLDVENTGKEWHMVSLSKFKDGKTAADVVKAFQEQGGGGGGGAEATTTTAMATNRAGASTSSSLPGGEGEQQDPFASIFESEEYGAPGGFQYPGSRVRVTTNKLDAGKYAVMCFIPTEGEGTPHVAKGMLASLEVQEASTPAPEPTATAQTFTLAKGKAPTGPATLPAGDVTFKVTGDADHEFTAMLPKPGKTFADADKYFSSVFGEGENAPPPAKGIAGQAPVTFLASVFDFKSGDTVYVTVNLKPGSWLIGCTKTENDDDDNPSNDIDHGDKELLKVTVT